MQTQHAQRAASVSTIFNLFRSPFDVGSTGGGGSSCEDLSAAAARSLSATADEAKKLTSDGLFQKCEQQQLPSWTTAATAASIKMSGGNSVKRKPSFLSHDGEEDEEEEEDEFDLSEAHDYVTELRPSRGSDRTSNVSSSAEDTEPPLDYDSVSSPGGSSTASGPIYIRKAGFEYHAHEVVASPAALGKQPQQLSAVNSSCSPTSNHSSPSPCSNSNSSGSNNSAAISRSNSVLSRHSFSDLVLSPPAAAAAAAACDGGGVSSSCSSIHVKGTPLKGVKKKKGLLSAEFKEGGKKLDGVSSSSSTSVSHSTRPKSRKGKKHGNL